MKRFLLMVGVALFGASGSASAVQYTFTDLGTLGGSGSSAMAINNSGQVAGFAQLPGYASAMHAVRWDGTSITDLGTLGGSGSRAFGINSLGQVVGYSDLSNGTTRATLWNGTTPTDLGTLGGNIFSGAYAINDAGEIVGQSYLTGDKEQHATSWGGVTSPLDLGGIGSYYESSPSDINNVGKVAGTAYFYGGSSSAIIWDGNIPYRLDALGGVNSATRGINDAGQVVGYSSLGNGSAHAAIWNGTTITDLGSLSGDSFALGINNSGQVVGTSDVLNDKDHATLWNGTTITDLNSFLDLSVVSAGWVLTRANAINDLGWIVGDAYNGANEMHGFLLTPIDPIPEPETYALMLFGLAVVGAAAKRKARRAQ